MRVTALKVIFTCLIFWGINAQAIDLSNHEKTCQEIGFKKKTQAFGECVLDLAERTGQTSSMPQNADDDTCRKYGFKSNTPSYAECRMKLDMAKAEYSRQQQQYEREKAAYEQQMAAIQKERERQRAMKQLELGLRMMGGQSPVDAVNSVGTNAPIAPRAPSPINQTITMPNGRMVNCTTMGTMTNCF